MEEYWDIYDENKQPTGRTMRRNDWNMQPGDFHLTVLGVLRRPDGRYLITQRAADKSWAPLWWEVPGAGVRAGVSSADTVRREVLEETGIDVAGAEGGFVFSYQRINPEERDNYFVDIYRFTLEIAEGDVHLQKEETNGFRFATHEEIRALAEQGVFLHYNSIRQVFEA